MAGEVQGHRNATVLPFAAVALSLASGAAGDPEAMIRTAAKGSSLISAPEKPEVVANQVVDSGGEVPGVRGAASDAAGDTENDRLMPRLAEPLSIFKDRVNRHEQGSYDFDGYWDPLLISDQCGAAVMLGALADAGVFVAV